MRPAVHIGQQERSPCAEFGTPHDASEELELGVGISLSS